MQAALWPKRITVRLVHIKTRLPLCAKGFCQYKNCSAKRTIYLFAQMAWMLRNAPGTSLATGHRENTVASCESLVTATLAGNVQQKMYPRIFMRSESNCGGSCVIPQRIPLERGEA